jgi:hypothetical protein
MKLELNELELKEIKAIARQCLKNPTCANIDEFDDFISMKNKLALSMDLTGDELYELHNITHKAVKCPTSSDITDFKIFKTAYEKIKIEYYKCWE